MGKATRVLGAVLLTGAMLLLSVYLPELVSYFSERSLLGDVRVEEEEVLSLENMMPLTLVDKLELVQQSPALAPPLDLGAERLTQAEKRAGEALEALLEMGFLPDTGKKGDKWTLTSCESFMLLSEGNGFVVWRVSFTPAVGSETVVGKMWMDDETGKALSLDLEGGWETAVDGKTFAVTEDELIYRAGLLANYLEMEVAAIGSQTEATWPDQVRLHVNDREGRLLLLTVDVRGFR